MRLAFVVKALNGIVGGAERVLCDVASGLARAGHEVYVLSFDLAVGESFFPLDPAVRRVCLSVGETQKPTRFGEIWSRMWALRREIKTLQPDIAIGFMPSAFIPLALGMMGSGIPMLASEHISIEYYKERPIQYVLLYLSSLFIRGFTIPSARVGQQFGPFISRKMTVIPNPVNVPERLADPSGTADNGRKIILNIGQFTAQKDQKTLIEAFSLIAPNYPDWDVRIIGEGELRPVLEEQIDRLGLKGRVILGGITADISQEYQQAQIFVLSSRYESFGLVTLEAMAHGLPCIGFADCPGTNEVIEHGKNGILVEGVDRSGALAGGMVSMISAPIDTEFREEIMRRYSVTEICRQWVEVFEAIQLGKNFSSFL